MDNFFSEIKNTAGKAVKKSSELVEMSKVKLNMVNTKSEISANFKVLGELVYLSQKDGAEPDTKKIEETIAKINELYERLDELTEVSSTLKNEKVCPNCTKSNPTDAQFCSGCGHKFTDNNPDDDDLNVEEITEVDVV